jgi:ABC-type dipeptide/oligopeptide/nickel transport system permease component
VKNLSAGYRFHGADGITLASIVAPVKKFKGHVFDHIFRNARCQYLSTIKEQASFVITGLIIIEMALNIHGYLNYEMLRQLLYRNYSIVMVIMLLIFYTVKMTEVFADYLVYKDNLKYENKNV